MKLKIAIFMFWILAGKWTKSAAQDNGKTYTDIRFCTLKICSLSSRTSDEIRVRIEATYCNDLPSPGTAGIPERLIRINSSLSCANIDDSTCRGVFSFLQTCLTFTQIQDDPPDDLIRLCQYCPNTIIDCPTTIGPPTTTGPLITTGLPTTTDPPTTTGLPTTIGPPTTTGPPTLNTDCPMRPSDVPTSSMPTFSIETDASSQISKVVDERDNLRVVAISLGVLVGILVVLLVVVTSGWVWTCWTMKRNKATTPEHVRTTQNTAYGVIGPVENSARARGGQTSGHQQRQTENDYQIMNEEGGEDRGKEHEYHVLEGPGGDTHVYHNRQLEMREVKESGEEHAYHVLEGPGGNSQRKEQGMRNVGGAMDYEIPQPQK